MKRLTWLGLAALASILLIGCNSPATDPSKSSSGDAPAAGDAKPLKVGIVFDSGGRGDKSFNDSAWAGIERAVDSKLIEAIPVESKSEKDYESNLSSVADKGAELVFAIGINMRTALEKVAPNYPDTMFAIVDGDLDGENVRCLLFKEEEGSFLVGYLAGLMSKTGKLGFVGGMDIPLIKKFEYGYAAGAKMANPKIEILPAKYTGSWDNVDNAKTAANFLFGAGADIVYHAAGRAGLGVIRAAEEKKLWAIGVDSDQDSEAPGRVLTSMIKRVDEAVYSTIKDTIDGKFTAEKRVYDLAQNGVGYSPLTHTKEIIGADNVAKVDAIKARIASGDIKVPASKEEYEAFLAAMPKG